MFDLNAEREQLLKTQGNLLVLGGPGSGKTTIALLKAGQDIGDGLLRPSQCVLFLSFARATVARVAQHAGSLLRGTQQAQLEINTYHGFAWTLLKSHGYLLRAGSPLRLLPPPEAAARLSGLKKDARGAEKIRLLLEEGLLHFDLFAKLSTDLLSRSRSLAHIVSKAYPLIVLDEFQDTNSEEWGMIRALGSGSRLIALADADQRIYEFRGADPKRIGEFIQTYEPTQFDFGLENNRSNGTDIVLFGNDLLAGRNKNKVYGDVAIKPYGFYQGRNSLFSLKVALIAGIQRQLKSGDASWSIAVLVPTKKLMIMASDYLSSTVDGLPAIRHDVALDTEGPALAADLIAGLLEGNSATAKDLSSKIISDLCAHIRGRKGNDGLNQAEAKLAAALISFVSTGKVTGAKRKNLVNESARIATERLSMRFCGDPGEDWLAIRRLLAGSSATEFVQVAEDAKFLRLLHKGAALRSRLGDMWRLTRTYLGASAAVRDALLQEHFSTSTKDWRGIHVMTIHKSKGKEFGEVFLFEGQYQGRFIWSGATESDISQARLTLRVGVTRAMKRATILTPRQDPCPFL